MKLLKLLTALLVLSSPATAQTINNLSAGSAVSGTDLYPSYQGANPAKKVTAAQIAVYTLGLVTGDCTINTSTNAITCLKTNGTNFGAFATATDAANLTGTINAARLPGTASFSALTASTSLTLSAITGSVQCLHVNSSGVVSGTGSDCGAGGGGTSPGGTSGQIQYNNAGVFGGLTIGPTLVNNSGTLNTAATVTAGTTQTVTTAQWAGGTTFVVTTAAQTITLPVSSSLATNGGIAIQTIGQSVTLAPNAADAINGGTTGASITLPAGLTAYATTDGAGNVRVSPTSAGSGSGTVSNCTTADAIAYYAATGTTVSCLSSVGTSGQVLTSNGAGVAPTWQNASGAGITFTDGTHTVTGSTQLTVTGGTVGGTTPNATLTVTGGSGAMTLVGSTCNFNNTTTFCTFTGLTGSEYELRCYGILTGNSAHVIGMQMATSGPTWKTGSSDYNRQLISVTGASTVTNTGVAGNGMAEITQDATGNKAASFVAHIHNLSSTSVFKSAETLTSGHNGGGYFISNETNMLVATGTDTAAVVGIRYGDTDAAPANMLSGSCSLYAVAN